MDTDDTSVPTPPRPVPLSFATRYSVSCWRCGQSLAPLDDELHDAAAVCWPCNHDEAPLDLARPLPRPDTSRRR